jgi:hypothetical protein
MVPAQVSTGNELAAKRGSAVRVRILAGAAVAALLVACSARWPPSQRPRPPLPTSPSAGVVGRQPLHGAAGTVTETIKGVTHLTELPNGDHHATTTGAETFTCVPDEPSEPTYTGKGTFRDGDNVNRKAFTLTFTAHIKALGFRRSRLRAHFVGQVTINPDGTATVQFETG